MLKQKTTINLLLLTICLWTNLSAAKVLSLAEAINRSGQQRMLSQRIAKNYLLIRHRINASDARVELDESIAIFEQNLINLHDTVSTPDCRKKLAILDSQWSAFRRFVLAETQQDNSNSILNINTELLNVANDLVLSLQKLSPKASAKLINIAGRQRMLSQRIALYYMASYVGIEDATINERFNIAVSEFDEGLKFLQSAGENTASITKKLKRVGEQWQFYQKRLTNLGQQTYVPRVIRVVTEGFLNDMDNITHQYEDILSASS